jgi:hypothetical protein
MAFEQGQHSVEAWYAGKKIIQSKQDYITNLKLDI